MTIPLEYQIKWNKVLLIIAIWMIIGIVITVYDWLALHSELALGASRPYTFWGSFGINIGAALFGGLTGGSFLVFYVNEKLRDKPYWKTIVLVGIAYVFIIILITVLLGLIFIPLITGKSLGHPDNAGVFRQFVFDTGHFKNLLVWAVVVGLTQLTLQINDKFGQGILWNFIRGFYQVPKTETRIFMFVDIQSSTAIAEKLGNEQYHLFLKEFYADMTNPIIYNKGEIYQYVGDEVVISWKLDDGVFQNRCLQCYFDMRKTIRAWSEKYQTKFGLVPEFKAGFHYGTVIAGEIGIIKRDITYSGDVLNTTARIQSLCNQYKVTILCSDELLDRLGPAAGYRQISLGDVELRGREQRIALSTLEAI